MKYFYAIIFLLCINLFACKRADDAYEILDLNANREQGLLPEAPPIREETVFKPGNDLESLEHNTLAYYTGYWSNLQKSIAPDYRKKAQSIIDSLHADIKVKPLSDRISLVYVPMHGMDLLNDMTTTVEIWVLKANIWQPIPTTNIWYRKALILDLNGDGFNDVVLKGGCCDTLSIDLFINVRDEQMKLSQTVSMIGKADVSILPNCRSRITVTHFQNPKITKQAKFSCKENKFT